jgi:hypothetical protein
VTARAEALPLPVEPDLDAGFDQLYELRFAEARRQFAAWEQRHPSDPLGAALQAAADLFEQFYRQGVLTSEFFLDDRRLLGGIAGQPDPRLESAFEAAARRSEERARRRLAAHPRDPESLFAMTLVAGMRADDASLIHKKRVEGLRLLRQADRRARLLLEVAPDAADAYLAMGAANYVIGCLPGYKQFLLWFGGIHGDKALGMRQLSIAASRGHYLRPFAKLLLALAALRENQPGLARQELSELAAEFPDNPLFAHELSRLGWAAKPPPASAVPSPRPGHLDPPGNHLLA